MARNNPRFPIGETRAGVEWGGANVDCADSSTGRDLRRLAAAHVFTDGEMVGSQCESHVANIRGKRYYALKKGSPRFPAFFFEYEDARKGFPQCGKVSAR